MLTIQVFLDEVNTASCPGFIKNIIIDHTLNGEVNNSNEYNYFV